MPNNGMNKRKRISQACDFCRNRHLKCDGEKQCYQCKSRDITCVYSPKKRRGPKPKNRKLLEKKQKTCMDTVDGEDNKFPQLFHSMMKQFCCRWGPTWIDLGPELAGEYYVFLQEGNFKDEDKTRLVDAFGYSVIFAYGAQILSEHAVSREFGEISLKLLLDLILRHNIYADELSDSPRFLEFIILLAVYYEYCLDFSKSRTVMSQALCLIEMKEYPADLRVRVFSFFMSGAHNSSEKVKWFEMATSLSSHLTMYTVMLFLF